MLLVGLSAAAYNWTECLGSALPYPTPESGTDAYPDSLVPVMINHVGRHGARYAASPKGITLLTDALERADSLGTITTRGRELLKICSVVVSATSGRWGQLDSLGIAEQEALATRMMARFPEPFRSHRLTAISSYVPRCRASMYSFLHTIALKSPKMEITTSSGPQTTHLMRFFSTDSVYLAYRDSHALHHSENMAMENIDAAEILHRVLGAGYPLPQSHKKQSELAMAEYKLLSGMAAISLPMPDISTFLTQNEYNALWSAANTQQRLRYGTPQSDRVARPLLANLVATTMAYVYSGEGAPVQLRFGHAETLMPLLSLMGVAGDPWLNFRIVPMAANLRLIVFSAPSGRHYMRVDLNEHPVALPGCEVYAPLDMALKTLTEKLTGEY